MSKVRMTKEQRAWAKLYKLETGFEALLDDFLDGTESFVVAAQKSNRWFEDWSNDAHLNITREIPEEKP
mgnify:CR=1 FL=1